MVLVLIDGQLRKEQKRKRPKLFGPFIASSTKTYQRPNKYWDVLQIASIFFRETRAEPVYFATETEISSME